MDGSIGYRNIAKQARLGSYRSGSSRLDTKVIAGLEAAFDAPVLERYGMSETGNLTANCSSAGDSQARHGRPTCRQRGGHRR